MNYLNNPLNKFTKMEQYFGFPQANISQEYFFPKQGFNFGAPNYMGTLSPNNVNTNSTMDNKSININTPTCHKDHF
jgi:hypothetical protein